MAQNYTGEVVYLTDLVKRDDESPTALDGDTFDDCEIRGPVVIVSLNSRFENCRFEWGDNVESMLYQRQAGTHTAVGVIGLIGCSFRNCNLRAVGLAGTAQELAAFRQAVT